MKTQVTEAAAEKLYAAGWRVESTILEGPRIVKEFSGVYATVVPTDDDYVWSIWEWSGGHHLATGRSEDVERAAAAAVQWVADEWLTL